MKKPTRDARWHQSIVVLSGACGLFSLAAGASGQALLAGVLGGITTMGSFLIQTLHCVKDAGLAGSHESRARRHPNPVRVRERVRADARSAGRYEQTISGPAIEDVPGMGADTELAIGRTESQATEAESLRLNEFKIISPSSRAPSEHVDVSAPCRARK